MATSTTNNVCSYSLTAAAADSPVKPPSWCKQLWNIRMTLLVILTPIILIPLPALVPTAAGKCAYAILIMATYWMSEVMPMAVTALLPVVIFPWLGIMETKKVCQNYFKDANMLFFGGLMVAVAVERWNLHKRIAMRVVMLVGTRPPLLMFGFMATTAFLSMWISNTATTAMMLPIAHAVLTELDKHRRKVKEDIECRVEDPAGHETGNATQEKPDKQQQLANGGQPTQKQPNHGAARVAAADAVQPTVRPEDDDQWFENMGKGMRLSIAYAANIGGTATLTGTGPNLVLKGQLESIFVSDSGVNFSSWFVFAFPNMLISLTLAWLWLIFLFIGPREILNMCRRRKNDADSESDGAAEVVKNEYAKLGRMSFAELMVLILFIILAVMWLTRNPEVVPGWQSLLGHKYVSDSCVAITISILLFVVPSKMPNYLCFRRRSETDDPTPAPALLDWPTVHKNIPWNVMLLLGGGFALADACEVSGLSKIIGAFFITFKSIPPWILIFILSTLTAAFTEVTSNVATATIFLPILADLAVTIGLNPLYLMLPVTVSASFAFMLPVATPPNAIVFAYGKMKIWDMAKAGIVMNIVCLLVLQLAINTWAYAYFGLHAMPAWAVKKSVVSHGLLNATTAVLLNSTTAPYIDQ